MRRAGYTMIELAIASLVGAVVLAAVMGLLVSGSRLFTSGMNAARGPEAAMLLMDRLEEDLVQILQVPGDPRPPAVISWDGEKVSFYRPDEEFTTASRLVGRPGSWSLVEADGDLYHPVKDGEPLVGILLKGWQLELFEPDADAALPGWFLVVTARFPSASPFGKEYVCSRVLHLPQPSANFLNYPAFGSEIGPGLVQLLPPPEDDESFEALAPPEGEEFQVPEEQVPEEEEEEEPDA